MQRSAALPARAAVSAVVAARAAVTPILATRATVVALSVGWSGERGRLGGLALRGGSAERLARCRDDPGGLRAHPEDAAAARGEDLEVEIVEPHPEGVTSVPESLFDGLAGEFLVCTHVSVVSLAGPGGRCVHGVGRSRPHGRPARLSW